LKSKGKCFSNLKKFKAFVEKQIGKKIKILRIDNGGEFTSQEFQKKFKLNGIQHQTSTPYTPQ
jgi:transposase InsO family protein